MICSRPSSNFQRERRAEMHKNSGSRLAQIVKTDSY